LYFLKNNKRHQIKIKKWKSKKNYFLIKIENISNRNKSDLLKNKEIFIYSKQLKKKKDEYFWYEIITCKVYNSEKKFLGKVKNIINTPSNDILMINNKKKEILVPFIEKKIIQKIQIKKKKIFINWKI
jgi:16S rRNA processing protein RimM